MDGKKILAVDDERHMLRLIEYNLSSSGYEVVTASNGSEALEKALNEKPDLILLDIKMPGMDGYEVCRELKNNPATSQIPIIFVSVMADDEKTKALGASSYILKPFSPDVLLKEIREVMGEAVTAG